MEEPEPLVIENFTPPPTPEPAAAPEPEPEALVIENFTPIPEPEPEPVAESAPLPFIEDTVPEIAAPAPPPPIPAPAPAPPAPAPTPVARASAAPVFKMPSAEPKPRSPVMMIAGGVVVVAAIGVGAMMLLRGRGGSEAPPAAPPPAATVTPAPPPAVDSAALRAADSARAADATIGFVHVFGDLPEDAELSLDTILMQGTQARVPAGSYTLSVVTAEFQPWERRITVRAGDTTRVRVDLELLEEDSTQQ